MVTYLRIVISEKLERPGSCPGLRGRVRESDRAGNGGARGVGRRGGEGSDESGIEQTVIRG